jgi:ribose transport system ATP-binding protein
MAGYSLSVNPFINNKTEKRNFIDSKDKMNIKCNSEKDLITSLSGGNQQKVIVGRWLTADSEILLLDNPTQGIDVGAKQEIYKLLLNLSLQGKTILFNTLEINEIQKIADNCVVFYEGRIEKILPREKIDEETVMMYATNAHKVNL